MLDYLLDEDFLLSLDGIEQNNVEYIKASFKLIDLNKRNNYLYKNYVKIKDKEKWFKSVKEHKEWADNNNKIIEYTNIVNKYS